MICADYVGRKHFKKKKRGGFSRILDKIAINRDTVSGFTLDSNKKNGHTALTALK